MGRITIRLSDRSQVFATVFALIRSLSEGRRLDRQADGVVAPSIRSSGDLQCVQPTAMNIAPRNSFALPLRKPNVAPASDCDFAASVTVELRPPLLLCASLFALCRNPNF
jgi:hypothetical protein